MISFLEQFSQDAQKIGWPGLLLGDISQPRGGPMLTGHASHQIGLDVDIWWRPMPSPRLTAEQRETVPFISMLDKSKFLTVDDRKWSPLNARLVMMAASYPQVERVFVNPAIKQKLCQTWTGDRTFMGKIRPIYGHDEHFHIRLECRPARPIANRRRPWAKATAATSRWPGGSARNHGRRRKRTPMPSR